jgi:hypothetical protein
LTSLSEVEVEQIAAVLEQVSQPLLDREVVQPWDKGHWN